MDSNQQVSQMLEEFSYLSMPWAYFRNTLAANGLTAQDSALIEEIWEEVNSPIHWIEPTLQSGTDLASAALKIKYSWLSEGAIHKATSNNAILAV